MPTTRAECNHCSGSGSSSAWQRTGLEAIASSRAASTLAGLPSGGRRGANGPGLVARPSCVCRSGELARSKSLQRIRIFSEIGPQARRIGGWRTIFGFGVS